MILGIGIDSVEIERFAHWAAFNNKQLLRIFNAQEIEYCLRAPALSAEKFAARFAAREALFKAVAHITTTPIPFLTLCKAVTVIKNTSGAPTLSINWDILNKWIHSSNHTYVIDIKTHISLTHTRTVATAYIVLEK